jgi:cyclophilin family peptidyl-prolyl cis-trans isomerase/HEAT repeat protein
LIGDSSAAAAIGAMAVRMRQDPALAALPPDDQRFPAAPAAEAFRLGIYALVRLRAYDALRSAVLDGSGQPAVAWWPVAFALQRIEDVRAAPALLAILQGPSRIGRAFAVKGLGALKHAPAVPSLLPLASNAAADPMIGVEAIRALGKIGDEKAVPALVPIAANVSVAATLRAEAVAALGGCKARAQLNLLLDLVSDASPLVRAAALRSVAQIDPDTFLTVLSTLDPDRHWTVRAALAPLLTSLDPEIAVPRLTGMLADQDLRARPAVMEALVKLRAASAPKLLFESLKHDDFVVRSSAATLLGELKPDGGAEPLAQAYRFGERDASYVARAAALGALAKYGGSVALETLKTALKDKDWAVRVRAAELLKPLDGSIDVAAAIRPAPGAHPPNFYEAPPLVAPTVSPHVYLDTDKGTVEIELNVIDAPLTAENFLTLARRGFFNGLAIHRVVPNFVVQDGDPRGDGEGGPGYTIRDELNELPYLRGSVGMALDWRDTGGSQFFITHSPQPHLDARYTVFGHVVSGMEVADRLEPGDVIRRVRTWDGNQMTKTR